MRRGNMNILILISKV